MIILVTGTPGSGKSLFVVSKILELQKQFPERQIFADIEGLQIDGVEKSPDDWRTTPDNSIVIYDEAQQHERFRSGTSANKDDVVQKLQVHRHTGHDIWFITQSPRFLNAFVLDLVGEHYHLHRPYGAKLASVYYWRSVRKQPQSLSSRELAENEFLFKYPKDLFSYYKSATAHHVKVKLPKKLGYVVFGILALAAFGGYSYFKPGTQKMINPSAFTQANTQQKPKEIDGSGLTPDQRKDLENPGERNAELQAKNDVRMETIAIKYNPNKPFDVDQSQIEYTVTAKPVFSGCIKKNGRYVAYTQQGTILHDVAQSDCKKLIEQNDRPFNYFAQTQSAERVSTSELSQPAQAPSSL
ncbi:zonular occludens toxin domain-containing protein [Acinetobacter baumannii]|uniref:zonular occludens toxin domain-containing protein n=1 Tax=Acinetobacter baumannii TaxID=470 RepID=UPI002940D7C2|nr:zonular occludens toxin domain-containing protein [Acinetobacter baumannii]MDV4329639.1 zonular occludens toxin domain-containing protein [Acinetobacter baumannii]MDV4332997.1 zonular occludens toxin domain-containing protein [Acinetobacter baumannii]